MPPASSTIGALMGGFARGTAEQRVRRRVAASKAFILHEYVVYRYLKIECERSLGVRSWDWQAFKWRVETRRLNCAMVDKAKLGWIHGIRGGPREILVDVKLKQPFYCKDPLEALLKLVL